MVDNEHILEKEIDLIQACINRMAQNSFLVKGWMISLVAIIIALLPETVEVDIRVMCIVAFSVTICFWYLDGFFLKMEKLYRRKYAWVIKNRMQTSEFAYDLDPHNCNTWEGENAEPNLITVMFSGTLLVLYAPVVITEVLVFLNGYFRWL